jgi:predicted lipoprotein
MQTEATLHDRYLASDAFWVWKEESQASWGVFDRIGDTWTERPQVVAWISRPHAARLAGTVVANEYDGAARTLHIETHGGGTHSVYVPEGYNVTCNGTAMSAGTGFVDVVCDGSLDVAP